MVKRKSRKFSAAAFGTILGAALVAIGFTRPSPTQPQQQQNRTPPNLPPVQGLNLNPGPGFPPALTDTSLFDTAKSRASPSPVPLTAIVGGVTVSAATPEILAQVVAAKNAALADQAAQAAAAYQASIAQALENAKKQGLTDTTQYQIFTNNYQNNGPVGQVTGLAAAQFAVADNIRVFGGTAYYKVIP